MHLESTCIGLCMYFLKVDTCNTSWTPAKSRGRAILGNYCCRQSRSRVGIEYSYPRKSSTYILNMSSKMWMVLSYHHLQVVGYTKIQLRLHCFLLARPKPRCESRVSIRDYGSISCSLTTSLMYRFASICIESVTLMVIKWTLFVIISITIKITSFLVGTFNRLTTKSHRCFLPFPLQDVKRLCRSLMFSFNLLTSGALR